LLNVGVLEIKSSKEFDQEQGTWDQRVTKVVPSTIKSKEFYVRL
jgi:hypothetical protein